MPETDRERHYRDRMQSVRQLASLSEQEKATMSWQDCEDLVALFLGGAAHGPLVRRALSAPRAGGAVGGADRRLPVYRRAHRREPSDRAWHHTRFDGVVAQAMIVLVCFVVHAMPPMELSSVLYESLYRERP